MIGQKERTQLLALGCGRLDFKSPFFLRDFTKTHVLVFRGPKPLILTKVIQEFEKNISLFVHNLNRLYILRIFFLICILEKHTI